MMVGKKMNFFKMVENLRGFFDSECYDSNI